MVWSIYWFDAFGILFRDGTSFRVTANGLEKQPGIFISRLVPGGLAEGTGLLAVNDEVLEVNGIEVAGKSLDQVEQCFCTLEIIFCCGRTLQTMIIFFNSFSGDRHDGGK